MSFMKELKTPVGVATALLVIVLLIGLVLDGFWYSDSVCTVCGSRRSSRYFLHFPKHTVKPTRLSEFLHRQGVIGEHKHKWLPVHGRSIWVSWSGYSQLRFAVRDVTAVSFLNNVLRYRGREECRKYAMCFLNPRTSDKVRQWIVGPVCAGSRDEFEKELRVYESGWRWAFKVVGAVNEEDSGVPEESKPIAAER